MRPRVHRHLARSLLRLGADLDELPEEGTEGFDEAVRLADEALTRAVKHAMRADAFTRRGERSRAASSWWCFRDERRRADLFIGFARILSSVSERGT